MSKYFSNYPLIQYKDKVVRDITRRSKLRDDLLSDPFVFLPYTIREGETPEIVAQLYYGSVEYTWLVLLANNMTDSYYDWPIDDKEFGDFFIEKYSEISGRTGFEVIRWGQDETRIDNIIYYYTTDKTSGKIIRVSPESFDTTFQTDDDGNLVLREDGSRIIESQNIPADFIPVRIFDYEKQQNENKREILLVDKEYKSQIANEFKRSFRK